MWSGKWKIGVYESGPYVGQRPGRHFQHWSRILEKEVNGGNWWVYWRLIKVGNVFFLLFRDFCCGLLVVVVAFRSHFSYGEGGRKWEEEGKKSKR